MTGFSRRGFIRAAGVGSAALALPLAGAAGVARAGTGAEEAGPTALRGAVHASGDWEVTATVLGWSFGGSLGSAATGIATRTGSDAVGTYRETTFTFASGARKGGIRVYDAASCVVFTDTRVRAGANSGPFPTFTRYPRLGHQLSHRECFGKFQFNSFASAADSPWVYFDASGNAFLLSAASQFQGAWRTAGDAGPRPMAPLPRGGLKSASRVLMLSVVVAHFLQSRLLAASINHRRRGDIAGNQGRGAPGVRDFRARVRWLRDRRQALIFPALASRSGRTCR